MASTQKSLRLLRNATLYTSKELAYNVLTAMNNVEDGVPVLARYTEGSSTVEKTLLGLYSKVNGGHMTVYDFDSEAREALEQKIKNMSGDVTTAIEEAIQALDVATITAGDGEFIKSIGEVDGKITATTGEMPTVAAISEAGKPIVSVSQTKGTVGATAGTINAEYVNIADAGGNFSSSTVEDAFAEVVDKYEAADDALKTEILGGASESANTLGELEALINNLSADAKSYSIAALTQEEINVLSDGANVREAYKLVDEDNIQSGATIKIYKDQTLKSAEYSGQTLILTYVQADGTETAVTIDMHDLIEQTEFASGVTWDATASKVRGVVDPTSEKFLTVGADGFKLSGVQSAIDNTVSGAVQTLDVTGDTAVAGQYVAAIEETDGIVAVKTRANVSEAPLNGYTKGSDSGNVAATDSINAAISKLENQIDAVEVQAQASKTIVAEGTDAGNNMTISAATDATTSSVTYTINLVDVASKNALDDEITHRKAVEGQSGDTYSANTTANYISGATSMNDADVKLDTALKGVADKVDTLSGKSITGIEMTGGTAAITANTDGTNQLTINTDASQLNTVNQISGATPIAAGTSVENALQTIYDNVNANKVVGSNAITTGTSGTNTQVSLKLDSAHTTTDAATEDQYSANRNALKITNDGLFLSDVWDAGTY